MITWLSKAQLWIRHASVWRSPNDENVWIRHASLSPNDDTLQIRHAKCLALTYCTQVMDPWCQCFVLTHLISPEQEVQLPGFCIHWQATDEQSAHLKQTIPFNAPSKLQRAFACLTAALHKSVYCYWHSSHRPNWSHEWDGRTGWSGCLTKHRW